MKMSLFAGLLVAACSGVPSQQADDGGLVRVLTSPPPDEGDGGAADAPPDAPMEDPLEQCRVNYCARKNYECGTHAPNDVACPASIDCGSCKADGDRTGFHGGMSVNPVCGDNGHVGRCGQTCMDAPDFHWECQQRAPQFATVYAVDPNCTGAPYLQGAGFRAGGVGGCVTITDVDISPPRQVLCCPQ